MPCAYFKCLYSQANLAIERGLLNSLPQDPLLVCSVEIQTESSDSRDHDGNPSLALSNLKLPFVSSQQSFPFEKIKTPTRRPRKVKQQTQDHWACLYMPRLACCFLFVFCPHFMFQEPQTSMQAPCLSRCWLWASFFGLASLKSSPSHAPFRKCLLGSFIHTKPLNFLPGKRNRTLERFPGPTPQYS